MHKSSLLFLTGIFCVQLTSRAQFFERIYSDLNLQSIGSVENTLDGGYLISGGRNGGFVLKTDASGDSIWSITDTATLRQANAVIQEPNGNIVVCGSGNYLTYSSVAVVARYDSAGNFVSNQIIIPTDGWGAWGLGMTRSPDRFSSHYFYYVDGFTADNYVQLDNGERLSGDNTKLTLNSLSVNNNGEYSSSANLAFDLDSLFNWHNNVLVLAGSNFPMQEYFFDTEISANALSDDGSLIAAGVYDSSGTKLVRLIKFDSAKNLSWDVFLHDPAIISVDAIVETADGGFALLCSRFDGANHISLIRTNSTGQVLWMEKFYGNGNCTPADLNVLPDGFLILGKCGNDPYLIRTDNLGQTNSTGLTPNENKTFAVTVFPNPSSGNVRLDLHGIAADNVRIAIYDRLGRSVYGTLLAKPERQLDLSFLQKGVYHFQLIADGEQLKCGKFVIE